MSDPTNTSDPTVTVNNANKDAPQTCSIPLVVQSGLSFLAAGVKTLNESLSRMEESLAAKPEVVAAVIRKLDGQIKTLQAIKSLYSSISRTSEPVFPGTPGSAAAGHVPGTPAPTTPAPSTLDQTVGTSLCSIFPSPSSLQDRLLGDGGQQVTNPALVRRDTPAPLATGAEQQTSDPPRIVSVELCATVPPVVEVSTDNRTATPSVEPSSRDADSSSANNSPPVGPQESSGPPDDEVDGGQATTDSETVVDGGADEGNNNDSPGGPVTGETDPAHSDDEVDDSDSDGESEDESSDEEPPGDSQDDELDASGDTDEQDQSKSQDTTGTSSLGDTAQPSRKRRRTAPPRSRQDQTLQQWLNSLEVSRELLGDGPLKSLQDSFPADKAWPTTEAGWKNEMSQLRVHEHGVRRYSLKSLSTIGGVLKRSMKWRKDRKNRDVKTWIKEHSKISYPTALRYETLHDLLTDFPLFADADVSYTDLVDKDKELRAHFKKHPEEATKWKQIN